MAKDPSLWPELQRDVQLAPTEIFDLSKHVQKVLFPVHHPNAYHWSLLIMNLEKRTMEHIDSMTNASRTTKTTLGNSLVLTMWNGLW